MCLRGWEDVLQAHYKAATSVNADGSVKVQVKTIGPQTLGPQTLQETFQLRTQAVIPSPPFAAKCPLAEMLSISSIFLVFEVKSHTQIS